MRKKMLAMLLILAMIISVVPVAAMAVNATDEHDCWDYRDYKYMNNGCHKMVCTLCDSEVMPEYPCDWSEGVCPSCGSTKPTGCQHDTTEWVDNGDGTHSLVCAAATCGEFLKTESHSFDTNGVCDVCGYECKHTGNHWKYVDNGNGTHMVYCTDCGAVTDKAAACVWENGNPCACGSTAPVCEKHDFNTDGVCDICGYKCDHMGNHWKYVDNGDGTHMVYCADCTAVTNKAAACVWENGKPCACGSTAPACDHTGNHWEYRDNGNGTHDVYCKDCGALVTKDAECVWENGKPCACGSTAPACDHTGNHWKYEDNGDGTHDVYCEDCGTLVTKNAECVWENGKPCACGSTKPAETTEPADKNLDKVPKTGDNSIAVLVCGIAVIACMGGAACAVVLKKKVF